MRASSAIAALVACAALTACLPAGRALITGRQVRTNLNGWYGNAELLAVTPDSIWVWRQGVGLIGVSTLEVGNVTVDKHRYGAQKTFGMVALTGLASGVALTAACSHVEEANCAAVIPFWMALSMLAAVPPAIANHYSSRSIIPARETERLRAYARYPQGLPDAVRATLRR